MTIGSGGFAGKGYLEGTLTQLKHVPEQSTDFIFCTIGEELGFLGTFFFLAIYLAFILRIIHLAERQRSPFTRIYCYSVASIFFYSGRDQCRYDHWAAACNRNSFTFHLLRWFFGTCFQHHGIHCAPAGC